MLHELLLNVGKLVQPIMVNLPKKQKRKLLVALLRWLKVDLLLEVVVKLKIQGENVLGLSNGCTQNKSWFSVKEMV